MMSEQEKKSGGSSTGGSSVVMMEQSATSRHKPFRPTDLQEEAQELHHKRSKAPAVPSVTEDLKESSENPDNIDRRELERAMSSEKQKHNAAKKISSNKRRDSSPETIALANVDLEKKKGTVSPIPKSVPACMGAVSSIAFKLAEQEKSAAEKKGDEDSITEEIAELRTTDVAKESEWSDEEEAGGLPRSDSCASRVSRVVRHLFCCGAAYGPPSEEDISSPRPYADGI